MQDQEIKDLIEDLESVGLSEDPSTIEVGKDGVLEITIGRNEQIETIYLLKRASYERIGVGNGNLCYLVFEKTSYWITCNSHDSAKKVAKKIQTFLNS
jgi:hypothetical protein